MAWLTSRSILFKNQINNNNLSSKNLIRRPLAVRAVENAVVAVDTDCDMDENFDLHHYPL